MVQHPAWTPSLKKNKSTTALLRLLHSDIFWLKQTKHLTCFLWKRVKLFCSRLKHVSSLRSLLTFQIVDSPVNRDIIHWVRFSLKQIADGELHWSSQQPAATCKSTHLIRLPISANYNAAYRRHLATIINAQVRFLSRFIWAAEDFQWRQVKFWKSKFGVTSGRRKKKTNSSQIQISFMSSLPEDNVFVISHHNSRYLLSQPLSMYLSVSCFKWMKYQLYSLWTPCRDFRGPCDPTFTMIDILTWAGIHMNW